MNVKLYLFCFLAALFQAALRADTSAVIPFANRSAGASSANASLDWIGESIAETVRDAIGLRGGVTLSRDEIDETLARLNLRLRTTMTQASALKLGETLDAEQVVYGTFAFSPDRSAPGKGSIEISARVFDRRKFTESAVFSESGNLEDLPTLEAHLAWRTLVLLAPSLAPPESDFRTLRPPVRLDAEENYIRGLMSHEAPQRERYFQQASKLDPKFGHAAYALGRISYERKDYKQAVQWLQKVSSSDVHVHEAQFWLGLALFQSGDYAAAQTAFQSVVGAIPLSEVLNNLGAAQSRRKQYPQAVEAFSKARDGDQNDPVYHFNLGYVLWRRGNYDLAADSFRASLERQPDDETAILLLGMCLRKQAPRPSDTQLESAERLKTNFEERAYLQLKALVEHIQK